MSIKQEILIVDDRVENLMALERTLAGTGASLVQATSGERALAATLDRDFALAILDVQMPGMDGYELAELLRGDPKTRGIPIVFLTASSREEQQIFKGYESGAVDYIVKPFYPDVLVSKVRVFLELHAQRAALREQHQQLVAVNQELEAFTSAVSHDLRAPLHAIAGLTELLIEGPGTLDPDQRELIRQMSNETSRMERLIAALLALSRVSRAEMVLDRVDLGDQAREIIARLRTAEPDRHVEVVIAEGLSAHGDPRLLLQVLENLLSNAWKFTCRTPRPRIEVGSLTREGRVAFFVKDNGIGFEMKHAQAVFAPFKRLLGAREYPGTGVGLTTVQRIVARHGGRVWCESEVERGTTFFFTLDVRGDG
jgi:signal transduction histidine kinase